MALSRAIEVKQTRDVQSDTSTFQELLLPEAICKALAHASFVCPSPVQEAALPLAVAGTDLIIQAKSGTGKTLVFSVTCLHIAHSQYAADSFPKVRLLPCAHVATGAHVGDCCSLHSACAGAALPQYSNNRDEITVSRLSTVRGSIFLQSSCAQPNTSKGVADPTDTSACCMMRCRKRLQNESGLLHRGSTCMQIAMPGVCGAY